MPNTSGPSNKQGWQTVEVDLGIGTLQTVELPPLHGKAKTPPTVAKDGMNQYQAAREIRMITKTALPPSASAMKLDLHSLRNLLNTRTTKAARLEQLELLNARIEAHTNAIAEQYKRIQVLAQNLPTVEHLPNGNDENIVRAFIAVLKSNGRV